MSDKERKLDIFMVLSEIDKKNFNLWDSLSEDQRKEFSPLVAMRWMSGTNDPKQIIFLNELVNTSVFDLGSHKELLLKLMTVSSSGSPKRYQWINYKLSSAKKQKMSIGLIAEHYRVSFREAEDIQKLLSKEEIYELGEIHGLQKEELKNLKKELS